MQNMFGQIIRWILFAVFITELTRNQVEGAGCISVEHCTACNTPRVCDQCNVGYGIDSKNRCQKCSTVIQNCVKCSSVSACTKCINDSFTVDQDGSCQPCAANCRTCRTIGPGKCDTCSAGFTVDSQTKTCTACQTVNCVVCSSDPAVCTTCKNGYRLSTTTGSTECVACADPNCSYCNTDVNKCDRCKTGVDPATSACKWLASQEISNQIRSS